VAEEIEDFGRLHYVVAAARYHTDGIARIRPQQHALLVPRPHVTGRCTVHEGGRFRRPVGTGQPLNLGQRRALVDFLPESVPHILAVAEESERIAAIGSLCNLVSHVRVLLTCVIAGCVKSSGTIRSLQ